MLSQFHPLVRFVSQRLQAEELESRPAVAVKVRGEDLPDLDPGEYVFTVQRWSLTGLQEIERLWYAAVSMAPPHQPLPPDRAEKLVVTAASRGQDWLGAPAQLDLRAAVELADEVCLADSEEQYRA